MHAELFFIYDSHCPWSYAATQLVNELASAYPKMKIHFWHGAYFEGDDGINIKQTQTVKQMSNLSFSDHYHAIQEQPKDSTLAANVLAWADKKAASACLPLLNAMQAAHFQQGLKLESADEITAITDALKLSPPSKALTLEKLTKDAEHNLHEIFEMQDIINTKAIPALLLAVNDNLILLNHNLYLAEPSAIVKAVELELNN
ncbi:MAG: DsbA family protein [Thalassotalea sp.]